MPMDQWELALAACYRQAGSGPLEPETVLRVLGDIYLPLLRTPSSSPHGPLMSVTTTMHYWLISRISELACSNFTGGNYRQHN
jgi:hypothetical protein